MIWSYIKSTLRDVAAHKTYSAINILGLAVGLAACLLIIIFVRGEFGYDSFVPAAERTYRLDITFKAAGRGDEHGAAWMGAYGPMLEEGSSEVEDVTRYVVDRVPVRAGDRTAYELVTFGDPNVLEFFGLGVPANVLEDQSAIVLTQSVADKYFERGTAVGQMLTISGKLDYLVAAVIPDLPEKTHLAFSIIAPIHETEYGWVNEEFTSGNTYTYVRMRPGRDPEVLQPLITKLIDTHVEPRAGQAKASALFVTTFVPVEDIYLKSKGGVDFKPGGDINVVYGFLIVALLILVIAAVNYVNLATAKAMKRAREIGMRKILGARRGQLIAQFLGESLLLTLISLVIAISLVEIVSPFLSGYLGRVLSVDYLGDPSIAIVIIGLTLAVGIGAGIYPAVYLSSFEAADALNQKSSGRSSNRFRQALVFVQFAITIALIAGASVVVRQTLYANTMDPGFNKEGVLLIRGLREADVIPQTQLISDELTSLPGAIRAVPSQFVPTDLSEWSSFMHNQGSPDDQFIMNILSHGFGYFDLYGIGTIAGRSLEAGRGGDPMSQIPENGSTVALNATLNERALELLGIADPQAALGRQVVWPMGERGSLRFTIVGVVRNFHLRSIRDQIKPMLYFHWPRLFRTISLRYSSDDFPAFLASVEATWGKFAPGVPLDYQVLEDRVSQFYEAENRQTRVFVTFAALAVIIASVGLLGLAAFAAERRTLEIGIRKTLGAGTADIMGLMVAQFSKPVVLANLVALPAAWWLTRNWLDGFVYRVDMAPGWFLAAGAIALLIAWVTVAGHAARAARANPIHALRHE